MKLGFKKVKDIFRGDIHGEENSADSFNQGRTG